MNDEYLLASLRMAAGVDPPPDRVAADARAVFALRLPGGIVATQSKVGATAGARSEGEPTMLRFTSDNLTIDLETIVTEGRMQVAGQVSPAPNPDTWVEVRTPHLSEVRLLTETGQFAAAGVPPGWISVVCHRPGQAPVATRWLQIRD